MDTVTLEYSQHICRVISTVFGAVLVGGCAIILFFRACRWIDKWLDNRQYRLITDRKVRIEKVRWNANAEREGWRNHDEYLVQALAGYAKENHDMREFMKTCKVIDLYERRVQDDQGTADDAE